MSSSLCEHCLKYLDKSNFIDGAANPDIPGTASVPLTKTLSSVAETAAECEICKLILSNAHEFEDNSPEISMEFILGPEMHDIKRVRLVYRGPVSVDEDFSTGLENILRTYIVHALPGLSIPRSIYAGCAKPPSSPTAAIRKIGTGPHQLDVIKWSDFFPTFRQESQPQSLMGDATLQSYDAWYSWLSIVREYMLRSLTKSKHKLRAIGGIAELYHPKTGDHYCAGLWRSHLAEELLWKVFHPRAEFSSMEALHQVVKEENWKSIYDLGPFAPLTSSIPGYHEMDVDFGTCHLDALEHEQYPEYRSVRCLEITSRVREGYVGNQQGLVLVNAAAEGTSNRIGIFGTHALGENWFEDAVHQIARII